MYHSCTFDTDRLVIYFDMENCVNQMCNKENNELIFSVVSRKQKSYDNAINIH